MAGEQLASSWRAAGERLASDWRVAGVQLGGMGSVRSVAASERAASPSMVVKVEENAFAPRPEPTAKILQPLKGGCRFLADFGVVPVMFYAILWPEPCLVEGVNDTHHHWYAAQC